MKIGTEVLTGSQTLPVRLRSWREIPGSLASCVKLAGYFVLFVCLVVVDTVWNFLFGRDKGSFDKFDELQ